MARPPRMEHPGAWHHVTARGNERKAIYRDERDREHFCGLLGEAVAVFGWRLHAYVLMDNHYHLLIETPEPNLSRGMHWLNVSYTVWFNRRRQRAGHLLQGRFKSIVVDPEAWALELSRYLHLNPVRVARLGLDKSARQLHRVGSAPCAELDEARARLDHLQTYRWSSYRAYLGLAKAPEWLRCERVLELGGGRAQDAPAAYRRYVESAIRQGLPESPWEQVRAQTILGGVKFARRMAQAMGRGRDRDKQRSCLSGRPPVAEIIAAVEKVKGEKWEAFRDRHGDWGRDLVFYIGRKDWAIKLRELGEASGTDQMTVSMAARRFARKATKNGTQSLAVKQCRDHLQMFYV